MPINFDFVSSSYISSLIEAIGHTHGVEATHQETIPIREIFRGKVAWEGDVEVFSVEHPSGRLAAMAGAMSVMPIPRTSNSSASWESVR